MAGMQSRTDALYLYEHVTANYMMHLAVVQAPCSINRYLVATYPVMLRMSRL